MKLTEEQHERYKTRYFWDTRRKTNDPESEGYGYDHDQMFLDLEHAENQLEVAVKALEKIEGTGGLMPDGSNHAIARVIVRDTLAKLEKR